MSFQVRSYPGTASVFHTVHMCQDTPNITAVWDQERQRSAPDSVKEELTALLLLN